MRSVNSLEQITDFMQSCSQFVAVEVSTVVLVFVLERRLAGTTWRGDKHLSAEQLSRIIEHVHSHSTSPYNDANDCEVTK